MQNGNGRPLSKKQTIRLLLVLTILAWATQTLLSQWGFGGEERFVPGSPHFDAGATLELRAEAIVVGEEVRLRQICRWSDRDDPMLAPIGDLIVTRLAGGAPFRAISVEEIRKLLHDAGVNTAPLNFAGAIACTVNRSDIEHEQGSALFQWIDARHQITPTTGPAVKADSTDENPVHSLQQRLIDDLAQRLSIPAETIQMSFNPQDEKVLALSEPLFKFKIEPIRARGLGEVSWNVLVLADVSSQKATIRAQARAWQSQVVLVKPLAFRQVIREEDILERRTLADSISDDPLVSPAQVVGQQAARELKSGAILTARMIDPVQLVRPGQYLTISLTQGNIQIKSVAKALEGGSFGETIRVKNETTRDVFQVVLSGPQSATMTNESRN